MSLLSETFKEQGFIIPDFDNSVLEVVRELADSSKGKYIGDKEKKVFLIADGLGYNLLEEILNSDELLKNELKDLKISRITTVFPSTTMNVMSTIHSGKTTAEHGVVGTNIFVKEFGAMVQCIKGVVAADSDMRLKNLDPKTIFPRGDTFKAIIARGRKFICVLPAEITTSGLSVATFNREDMRAYISMEDMMVKLSREINAGYADFIFAYYSIGDKTEHSYGPSSEEAKYVFKTLLRSVAELLLPAVKKHGYNLIITADHGQIDAKKVERRELDYRDEIMEYLTMPGWGESRAVFVEVKAGMEGKFEEYMKSRFDFGLLIKSDDAIKEGLFGAKQVSKELRYRFGTHIFIPKGNRTLYYLYPGALSKTDEVIGTHGGLSADEMYVPLMLY